MEKDPEDYETERATWSFIAEAVVLVLLLAVVLGGAFYLSFDP